MTATDAAAGTAPGRPDRARAVRRYGWVAVLYFAQGLPFGLVNYSMPLAFSKLGVSLQDIGLLSLAGLPWTFKFLWAPLVDRLGRRRDWMVACLLAMAAAMVAFGFTLAQPAADAAPAAAAAAPSAAAGPALAAVAPLIWALVVAIALLSATQDIAIDAATIETLERSELGAANGVRVTSYRVALIAAGSGIPLVATAAGWRSAWLASAAVLALLAAYALRVRVRVGGGAPARGARHQALGALLRSLGTHTIPPLVLSLAVYWLLGRAGASNTLRTPLAVLVGLCTGVALALRGVTRPRATGGAAPGHGEAATSADRIGPAQDDGIARLLSRQGAPLVALFVLTFKLGDAAMTPMTFPFLDRGAHLSTAEIGLLLSTFGIAANVAGALLGGWLTTRWGIFRALWVLGLFQAVSNFGYAAAALHPVRAAAWTAAIIESFCGGLGTAPFLAFLMSICHKEHAATQYAFLSAIYGLSRSVAGAFSGFAAQPLGFSMYFAVTFVLALPAFALLPALRRGWIGAAETGAPASG